MKMGKPKHSAGHKGEAFKISKRIRANINVYKNHSYCHFSDVAKDKSISMNLESVKKLCKVLPKILKSMAQMEENVNSSSSCASESD